MHEKNLVNITMVTFNRLELTRASLKSVIAHTRHPHMLTVVDNASTDGTREYLTGLHQRGIISRPILLKRNMGVSCAANTGWAAVPEATHYMKLDNDIIIKRTGWLSAMVAVAERNPQIGMLAYPVTGLPHDGKLIKLPTGDVVVQAAHCGGACTLIRGDVHKKLGYWCEDYGLYGEEDSDYGARVQLAGLANAYMPDEQAAIHAPHEAEVRPYEEVKSRARRRKGLEQFLTNTHCYRLGLRPLYMERKYLSEYDENAPKFSLNRDYTCAMREFNSEKNRVVQANNQWIEDYVAGRA